MPSLDVCVYCDKSISPTGIDDEAPSIEHVVGRALGGALTIPTHKGCNGRANQLVDSKLAALPDLGRIRARLGIRSGSEVYVHREAWESVSFPGGVLESPKGIRAFISWTRNGRRAKLIPNEIPRGDSGDTEIFIEPEDSAAYEEKRRKRVEREGCYLGEPRESTDPSSLAGKEVAILFREPAWTLPAYLWPAAVAKFGLGVIADGCRKGLLPSSAVEQPVTEGLRTMAFEKAILTDLWDADSFRYEPSKLDATSVLAQLERHEHLLAIRGGEAGQSAVLQVVVFGRIAHELELPGLPIDRDRAWLFDSQRRKVTRLAWEDLEEQLSARTPTGAAQLALAIGG